MFRIVGSYFCDVSCGASNFIMFSLRAVFHCCFPLSHFRQLFLQVFRLGYLSLPMVSLAAIFTGAVLTLQSYTGFSRFHIESAIPGLVVISMTRELGPVLIGLIFAGRVGAGICSELGSMKVTEQIDALPTLYADPFRYLVSPRVIAGIISLPILVLIGDIIGVYGGYLVGVYKLGFNKYVYVENTIRYLDYVDIISGLVKAFIFGFLVTLTGCYYGCYCGFGAQGVGIATTKSVVMASVFVLLANYLITLLFFHE